MSTPSFRLACVVWPILFLSLLRPVAGLDSNETKALQALFSRSWITAAKCDGQSVVCSAGNANVIELNLDYRGLKGPLATELGLLKALTALTLSWNSFNGTIITELGLLKSLALLDLSGNQLNGSIPSEVVSLKSLTALKLWANQLTGTISTTVGQLTSLKYLGLSDNRLSGTIPSELSLLKSLTSLSLSSNKMSGTVAFEILHLPYLAVLDIKNNLLHGHLNDTFAQPGRACILGPQDEGSFTCSDALKNSTLPSRCEFTCGLCEPFCMRGTCNGRKCECSPGSSGATCLGNCTLSTPPAKASVGTCGSVFEASNCSVQCNPGYSPQPATALCSYPLLLSTQVCTADGCKRLAPGNGTAGSCKSVRSGERCSVECFKGFTPQPFLASCEAGSLTIQICNANGCDGTAPGNGTVGSCESIQSGSNCSVDCDNGYLPHPGTAFCSAGSLTAQECIAIPPVPPKTVIDDAPTQATDNLAAIIGGAVGGAAFLLLVALIVFLALRHRNASAAKDEMAMNEKPSEPATVALSASPSLAKSPPSKVNLEYSPFPVETQPGKNEVPASDSSDVVYSSWGGFGTYDVGPTAH